METHESAQRFKPGTDLVLKVIKTDMYQQGVRITHRDIEGQDLAVKLAFQFNDEVKPVKDGDSCNVYFRRAKLTTAHGDKVNRKGTKYILDKESMIVEQRIWGDYDKFNSNSGWSSGTATLPDAFSHWTWVKTGGEHLVCDLQGHRGRPGGPKCDGKSYYYMLTDPVVLSRSEGKFGCADLGLDGQMTWFAHHECNSLCKSLGLEDRRPQHPRRAYGKCRGTTYEPMAGARLGGA